MDMEIQPAIVLLANGKMRLDAHEILGDMLKAFALTDLPGFLSSGSPRAKNWTTASSP